MTSIDLAKCSNSSSTCMWFCALLPLKKNYSWYVHATTESETKKSPLHSYISLVYSQLHVFYSDGPTLINNSHGERRSVKRPYQSQCCWRDVLKSHCKLWLGPTVQCGDAHLTKPACLLCERRPAGLGVSIACIVKTACNEYQFQREVSREGWTTNIRSSSYVTY